MRAGTRVAAFAVAFGAVSIFALAAPAEAAGCKPVSIIWTIGLDLGELVYSIESFPPDDAWLRTEKALYRWDGASWSQVALPSGTENHQVVMNGEDGVWVPAPNGLAVWGDGSWQETPYPEECRDMVVTASPRATGSA